MLIVLLVYMLYVLLLFLILLFLLLLQNLMNNKILLNLTLLVKSINIIIYTWTIINVLLSPDKLSCNKCVNFESRNGTWLWLELLALITFPNAVNDWLILIASLNLSSVAPVFLTLSEPAKSIKCNFPTDVWPEYLSFVDAYIEKILFNI